MTIRFLHLPLFLPLCCLSVAAAPAGAATGPKNVLILVEGRTDPTSPAIGDGRQLANLLGHFNTTTTVLGLDSWRPGSLKEYDFTFYVGFNARNAVPVPFLDEVITTDRPFIWLHTGFVEFAAARDLAGRFGFTASRIDSSGRYDRIVQGTRTFTKDEPILTVVHVTDPSRARIEATAVSSRSGESLPYIIRSGSFLYVADCPFALAGPTDRYLLFADMLHDILGEEHEESHTAIVRIEDVNPMENADRLRDVADILSDRNVPFLVGVTPIYVNPGEGLRVTLSDKPDIVDALKYMVRNGGTIVMHGTTHQYKGVTGSDFEFWDEAINGPIREENTADYEKRIELGLQEFLKNGLVPLLWETPHYAASQLFYSTAAKYFSTAIEQRLVIENSDYSQFFPYIIQRDIHGQRIYPENLGFFPLELEGEGKEAHLRSLLEAARTNLQVRDGYASHFFHAFVDPAMLERLVDGIQAMGYTYLDVREGSHQVRMKDRALCSGEGSFALTLLDQYLQESTFGRDGELVSRTVSDQRVNGTVRRDVRLQPGEFYRAEPVEFRERELSFTERAARSAEQLYDRVFAGEKTWSEARPVVLWNHYARGAAYNDQASLASVFGSLNITVDTIFTGQRITLAPWNLAIVPFAFVDSMRQEDFDAVVKFVEEGGCLITDTRNDLAEELGITFSTTYLDVGRILDRLFPEERVAWRYEERMRKFECDGLEEVFCVDYATEAPVAVGKRSGKGKVIFFGTRFDPYSQLGYSHYPFLAEYVRRFFALGPVVRRDQLEMYFDPGFRQTQSVESLVKLWVQNGIRRIHVAGWHEYPKYTYDYARLIRLAHANGIQVYAWIEPPQVSQKFWMENPAWREKNYQGEDVRPSWRYPVALTDTACVAALTRHTMALLDSFDFDGVNLAELYFEAGKGFDQPALWSPMHASAVREFLDLHGFDLRRLFDAGSSYYWKRNSSARALAVDYRVRSLNRVYRTLLSRFASLAASRPGFQVVVTAMDSEGSPELREYIGVDMNDIIGLQREFGFVLQVEDPEHLWSTDPTRYVGIGERYSGRVLSPDHLMLDLNILGFRRPDRVTPFPTLVPTGTEAFHLVRSAAFGARRTGIYSESSVNPQDLPLLPFAAAAQVTLTRDGNTLVVAAPYQVGIRLPPGTQEISVDGNHQAPGRENVFLIPAGEHRLELAPDATAELSGHRIQPRLLSMSGTLLSASFDMRTVTFEYDSDARGYVTLDREPVEATLDGAPYPLTIMKGNDCYSFRLPQGRHRVEVVAGDLFAYGINVTSFWSTTGIALFGLVAVVLLLAMYMVWVVRRRPRMAVRPQGEV